MIKGSRGAFEVAVDGQVIYSKHLLHRFPEPGEVEQVLEPLLAAG